MLDGLEVYHRHGTTHPAAHCREAGQGSATRTLFITCTDSRIIPNARTCSGPGDMFTLRISSHQVPSGQLGSSVEAAIALRGRQARGLLHRRVRLHSGLQRGGRTAGRVRRDKRRRRQGTGCLAGACTAGLAAFDSMPSSDCCRRPRRRISTGQPTRHGQRRRTGRDADEPPPRQHALCQPAQGDQAVLRHHDRARPACAVRTPELTKSAERCADYRSWPSANRSRAPEATDHPGDRAYLSSSSRRQPTSRDVHFPEPRRPRQSDHILEVQVGCTRKILNQRSFHTQPLLQRSNGCRRRGKRSR